MENTFPAVVHINNIFFAQIVTLLMENWNKKAKT